MGSKVPTLLKAQLDFKGREAHWGSVATTLQQRCNIVATTLQQRCKHSNYLMILRYLYFGRQNLVVRGPKQDRPQVSGGENLRGTRSSRRRSSRVIDLRIFSSVTKLSWKGISDLSFSYLFFNCNLSSLSSRGTPGYRPRLAQSVPR